MAALDVFGHHFRIKGGTGNSKKVMVNLVACKEADLDKDAIKVTYNKLSEFIKSTGVPHSI